MLAQWVIELIARPGLVSALSRDTMSLKIGVTPVIALVLALVGCAAAEPEATQPPEKKEEPAGPGDLGAQEPSTGTDPSGTCASVKYSATTTRRPVDVILWVDDGGSFNGARTKVASSINKNLAEILENEKVDYRVILLSSDTAIAPPLSTSGRLFRAPGGYSAGSGGYIFFSSPQYVAKYLEHVRADAFKVFLSATDCENSQASGSFESFEAALEANGKGNFKTGGNRNFMYDMIGNLALKPGSSSALPWLASDVLATKGGYNFPACIPTQEGAIKTGGFRLGVGATSYDELFKEIAKTSIQRAKVPCSFSALKDQAGADLDLARVQFHYQPSAAGAAEQLSQRVASLEACTDAGGFYQTPTGLELCPSTCTAVQADPEAKVEFSLECSPLAPR
jgi:hypothetical protein